MVCCENVIMWIIPLENTAKKIQHGSKVNYAKYFLLEQVSSETQRSSKCYE